MLKSNFYKLTNLCILTGLYSLFVKIHEKSVKLFLNKRDIY